MDLDFGPGIVEYNAPLPTTDIEMTPTQSEENEGSPIHKGGEKVDLKSQQTCFEFFKIERHLIKFKSFFFFFGGAIGSVFPYFSVYYKQLGLSPNQIGIISGLRPIIGFFSGPLWGSLADRFRVRRIMLFISALGWLAFITAIGFVPPAEISDAQCPYVRDFVGNTKNITNVSVKTETDVTRADFNDLHRLRVDVTAEESLMESRGWIYDSADLYRVYTVIMILVVLGELVQSPCGALADSGCIETLGNKDMHKYGHQRAWGSLGLGIMSVVVGGIISTMRRKKEICDIDVVFSNYHIAFYFFAGCMFCCTITTFFFKFQKQVDDHNNSKPKPNPFKVFKMFLTIHYGSWLLCMFFTGICNGVIWGFLFWHLENLGNDVIHFEYTLFMANVYLSDILRDLQGFLHGVYWGLGSGTGHMIGGISVETLGARVTFWIFAGASFFNLLLFIIVQKCTTKPDVFGNYEELDENKA
ncbi:major facilitator superfamily domain-containing protein 6-like [Ruditapes philippinarum]|uniref:major facilitator superfamily domain-containing protein 6-like n=1 Tax=Ruditapes philippinarum TaxID=129788 RepID=UPI00295C20DB|nr:major facilitator superfamily domain-containing protein 6-like [Ruditapes philippinarum]